MKKYFLNRTITDEAGGVVAHLESREMPADEVISEVALRFGGAGLGVLEVSAARQKKTKGKKPKAGKKGKCPECGSPSRHKKDCTLAPSYNGGKPVGDERPAEMPRGPEGVEKTKKIKRMLSEHVPHPEIARECGTSTQVVSFMARQMQSRGEL